MRALYFLKIDYILTRKQMYIVPLVFVLALVTGKSVSTENMSLLVSCSYMLFLSTIFSTAPFGYCVGKNRGFLLLFPATVKDRVAGRFLYGLSFVALLALLCCVVVGVYVMLGVEIPLWTLGAGLCELAVGIVITTLEILIFYLFGEGKENWQYLSNIVRVAPGMAMFFAASYLIDDAQAAVSGTGMDLEVMTGRMMQAGALAVAAALLLTVAAAAVCVKVIEKRDYA